MDNTYSIKNLIALLLRKIWIIIAVTLFGGIAAFCVSKFVIPLKYSSHISMYVQSYTGISNESSSNYNDISKSKQLINTYIEVLKDDAVMESVGNSLTKQFDEKIISENFSVSDNLSFEAYNSISNEWNGDEAARRFIKIVQKIRNGEDSYSIFQAGPCSRARKKVNVSGGIR